MAKTILILFVLAAALIAPDDLSSCGPFFPEALFSARKKPFDEKRYFSGRLDIIQPHYERIYLMAAYRYLSGIGLSAADRAALVAPPAQPDYWSDQNAAVEAWLKARVLVGAPAIDRIDRYKMYSQYTYVLNCGDDAFQHAASALGGHFQAGLDHDELRAWVAAQDQVFADCASPSPQIPPPAAVGAPLWMQADRAYQIAAAEFYAGEFDAAAADFRRVAGDHASPWHGLAAYLAARALIRKTTLDDAAAVPAAREQLQRVLADADAAAWHESARGLLRYLQARTDPQGALRAAAYAVETQRSGVAGAMNDYRLLLDHFENHQQNAPQTGDITDWIAAMQYDSADHSLEKWRATHSLTWLVAALTWADKPDPEVMAAAARVAENSPAYTTVQFHRLRLMAADEARPNLDAMLHAKMPAAARNLFLAERMRVARNWDELLAYAPRVEAGTLTGGFQEPATGRPTQYFDDDSAHILDRQASLAVLRAAAQNPSLPANLQLRLAQAAWVRSIMLQDADTARAIAPVLAKLAPYLKPYLDAYMSADNGARQFAATWLLLNNPGMRPSIDSGIGRQTATPRIDDFRDNWWCPVVAGSERSMNAPLEMLYQGSAPEAAFLSAADRAAAQRQRDRIDAFPAAPTFLARQAAEWAGTHPDDPRVPESLRLAVRAARFACAGDPQTDRWSKRAFRLLHARYARTEAARHTPYWYRSGAR